MKWDWPLGESMGITLDGDWACLLWALKWDNLLVAQWEKMLADV